MPSSITAAGVVFPDATVQTTAAGAGGSSLEAVASGSLSNGSTVVVNTDGTVSVVSAVAQNAGTPAVFEAATSSFVATAFDSVNDKIVIAYRDSGNSGYGTAVVGTVSGTSISFGTPTVFESAATDYVSASYDSTSQKTVIVYSDLGNSSYGTAIVGTVSGTSISFGTAVVFESATAREMSATFDSTNNKTVIAYYDGGNSFYGTAIVGTVSGTSISFGTAVVFKSAYSPSISAKYASASSKIVISYRDDPAAEYGKARVGTVSGTSISFGAEATFESAATEYTSIAYDDTNDKIVIAYRDSGNSGYGTAVVGTISGTSISFGSAVVFESASTEYVSASYDQSNKKVTVSYKDVGNSNYGTIIAGTISGTSISFGSALVFESASTNYISSVYDSTNSKVVVAYQDTGNSNYGTSVVFQNESTNLTSENYIGISDGAYTNGQTATVQLLGSVDDAQTGLTAGQKYYVTKSGTLSQTPDTPSVLAGTAVSATKLVIKR